MASYVDPISELVHSTVRILAFQENGESSSGTGYVYLFCEAEGRNVPCIVTNKHVLRDAAHAVFNLTLRAEDGSADIGRHEAVTVHGLNELCIPHPDNTVDLVALPIGAVLNAASKKGSAYHFVALNRPLIPGKELLATLSPMEEIVMIGYPNGIWDQKHNLPIIRRGITATHARLPLNGKPEFLIDAACFPGSSGSPVFLANIGSFVDSSGALCAGNRIALLGTLYAGPQHTTTGEVVTVEVPTDTKALAVGSIPNNLGLVISSLELFTLENAVREATHGHRSRNSLCPCGSGRRLKLCCGKLA